MSSLPEPAADSVSAEEIALVCALRLERQAILQSLTRGTVRRLAAGVYRGRLNQLTVHVWQCGIGHAETRRRLPPLLESCSARLVISCGLAGGTCRSLRAAEVITAASVFGVQAEDPVDCLPLLLPSVVRCERIFSPPAVVAEPAAKQQIAVTSGAAAVDLESETIARIARDWGIACAVLRVISDDAETCLRPEFVSLARSNGEIDMPRVLHTLLTRPGLIGELRALNRVTGQALIELTRCLQQLDRQTLISSGLHGS